jgi:hypothetical protein
MDIATLYARHGQPGLDKLAKEAGLKVSYLQRLLYRPDCRPSIERADLLIKTSARLFGAKSGLTLQGLTNPKPFRDARAELGESAYKLRRAAGAKTQAQATATP